MFGVDVSMETFTVDMTYIWDTLYAKDRARDVYFKEYYY
jgi:hypothetical protein